MPKVKDYPYDPGGLMRCCIATLANHRDDEVNVGDRLKCDYEDTKSEMVLGEYGWYWGG
jgi:hypothetical protein